MSQVQSVCGRQGFSPLTGKRRQSLKQKSHICDVKLFTKGHIHFSFAEGRKCHLFVSRSRLKHPQLLDGRLFGDSQAGRSRAFYPRVRVDEWRASISSIYLVLVLKYWLQHRNMHICSPPFRKLCVLVVQSLISTPAVGCRWMLRIKYKNCPSESH